MTFVILKVISVFMQVRSDESHEDIGLDIAEHGERGYTYQDVTAGSPLAFSHVVTQSEPVNSSILQASHTKSH
jgi:Amt family ammonium transporter